MNINDVFVKLSREKVRFVVPEGFKPAGVLSIEHLWGLAISKSVRGAVTLEALYDHIDSQLESTRSSASDAKSKLFGAVTRKTADVRLNELRLAALTHVIETRKLEAEKQAGAVSERQERDRKKELLKARIEEIDNGEVGKLSKEEALAQLSALG